MMGGGYMLSIFIDASRRRTGFGGGNYLKYEKFILMKQKKILTKKKTQKMRYDLNHECY